MNSPPKSLIREIIALNLKKVPDLFCQVGDFAYLCSGIKTTKNMKAFIERDSEGYLLLYSDRPPTHKKGEGRAVVVLDNSYFPELSCGDKPIEVTCSMESVIRNVFYNEPIEFHLVASNTDVCYGKSN